LVTSTSSGATVSTGTWAVTAPISSAAHDATSRAHSQRNTHHGDMPAGAH
jgi:hypothetical protein